MSGKQGLWTPSPSIKYLHMRHCFSTESLHFAGRYGCIWWCRWYCGMGILGLQHCFRCGVWVLGATSKVGGQCRLGRTITMDEWHFLQPVVWNYCLVWRFQVASRYLDKAKHLYLKIFEVDSDISSEIPDIPDAWHLNQPLQDPWSTLCIRKYFPLVRAILLVCKQSGWWFQTFFIFPYIGNYHPNWIIFFRGVRQPPTRLDCSSHLPSGMLIQAAPSGYAAQAWFRVLAHGGDRVSWRSVSSWQCLGLAFLDEITSRG